MRCNEGFATRRPESAKDSLVVDCGGRVAANETPFDLQCVKTKLLAKIFRGGAWIVLFQYVANCVPVDWNRSGCADVCRLGLF